MVGTAAQGTQQSSNTNTIGNSTRSIANNNSGSAGPEVWRIEEF
jgi:hypothetical protein